MSTFRDAIALACAKADAYDNMTQYADALLAMPEMQAIKVALLDECHTCCTDCWREWAALHHLPESVIEWVVGS